MTTYGNSSFKSLLCFNSYGLYYVNVTDLSNNLTIFKQITVLNPANQSNTSDSIANSSSWILNGTSYYLKVYSPKSFNMAEMDCESQGGYLISLNNQNEYNFLKDFMSNDSNLTRIWVGASVYTPSKFFDLDNGLFNIS